jgi:hypothetical protein
MAQISERTHFGDRLEGGLEKLGALWCQLMHDAPMWPMHGRYECATCGREYLVPWGEHNQQPAVARQPVFTQALAGMRK